MLTQFVYALILAVKAEDCEDQEQCLFDLNESCSSIITYDLCYWNVVTPGDLNGPDLTIAADPADDAGKGTVEGNVCVGGATDSFKQFAFNYRNTVAPTDDQLSVSVVGQIEGDSSFLIVSNGFVESGTAFATTITGQTVAAAANNVENNPNLNATFVELLMNQLICLKTALCSLMANSVVSVDQNNIMTFDAGNVGDTDSVAVFAVTFAELVPILTVTGVNFDKVHSIVINITDDNLGADATWDILFDGDFIGNEGKVLFNFCTFGENIDFSTHFHGSILMNNSPNVCTFTDTMSGGVYGCGHVTAETHGIETPSFCGGGFTQAVCNAPVPIMEGGIMAQIQDKLNAFGTKYEQLSDGLVVGLETGLQAKTAKLSIEMQKTVDSLLNKAPNEFLKKITAQINWLNDLRSEITDSIVQTGSEIEVDVRSATNEVMNELSEILENIQRKKQAKFEGAVGVKDEVVGEMAGVREDITSVSSEIQFGISSKLERLLLKQNDVFGNVEAAKANVWSELEALLVSKADRIGEIGSSKDTLWLDIEDVLSRLQVNGVEVLCCSGTLLMAVCDVNAVQLGAIGDTLEALKESWSNAGGNVRGDIYECGACGTGTCDCEAIAWTDEPWSDVEDRWSSVACGGSGGGLLGEMGDLEYALPLGGGILERIGGHGL